jgi:hypothetical protein
MHTLLIPLLGLPVAIGLFALFNDLKRMKNWNIEPDPLAQPTANALESVAYVDRFDGATADAIGAGIESGIEAGAEAAEAGAEAIGEGIAQVLETAGHFLHH